MKLLLLCAKGFEMMEFSPFIDVFGWAGNDYGYDVQVETCGFQKEVVSAFGVPVLVDRLIGEICVDEYDALAIPGGFQEFGFFEEAFDGRVLSLIQEFFRQEKVVAAVCVGALVLGKSGILRGKRATTYHLRGGNRQKQLAELGAVVVQERIVVDETVITSYCPETAADVAFAVLEKFVGLEKTKIVRREMGFASA